MKARFQIDSTSNDRFELWHVLLDVPTSMPAIARTFHTLHECERWVDMQGSKWRLRDILSCMASETDRRQYIMRHYPRLTAHVIAESLGYATPSTAAGIIADAVLRQSNWCEWVSACYACDPVPVVRQAIACRHSHKGFMAEYRQARLLVDRAVKTGEEPLFASWF